MSNGDDNYLTLATIGTCLEHAERCTNGMTLAFWVKVSQGQVARFPTLLSSSSVTCYSVPRTTGFWLRFYVQETATQRLGYGGSKIYSYDQWHLMVVAYSAQSGTEFYLNGCPLDLGAPNPGSRARVAGNLIVGCNKAYCMIGNWDDLRFWTSKKDKHFMWTLWSL